MAVAKSTAPKKKKGSLGKIIGIVALVFVFLIIVGIITAVSVFKSVTGPQKAAKTFVETVSSGDISEAYNSTTEAFREVTTEEDLAIFLESFPILAGADNVSFNQFSINNESAVVSGTIRDGDQESPITFTMVQENGKWKVMNFSLNPDDVPKLNDDSNDFNDNFESDR